MKGLKIVLWIAAILFLLNFLAVIIPWTAISAFFSIYDVDISGYQGLMKYGFRIAFFLLGFIGVYFVLLARNPLQYGPMLSLAGIGSLLGGLFCLAWGAYYRFTWWYWIGDVLFFWIWGTLFFYFKSKAMQAAGAAPVREAPAAAPEAPAATETPEPPSAGE